ncbi:MAG: hypothetical protein R2711_17115 [Acidimicrobiales bacterium]
MGQRLPPEGDGAGQGVRGQAAHQPGHQPQLAGGEPRQDEPRRSAGGLQAHPHDVDPTLLAHPESSVGQRAGFARHNLWVTPYAPDERRAAGEFPNQSAGGDGLPAWTAADRDLDGEDVVLWYSFGITHFPRPEDWPVMPTEYTGFLLSPFGFFERNPALDVAPSPPGPCHAPSGDDATGDGGCCST